MTLLRVFARHGRFALAAGLVAGLLLPGVAAGMKPWLPHMVVFLLFLTAFRIGPRDAFRGLKEFRATLGAALAFQLVLPLAALAVFGFTGISHSPYALAVVLVLAAPALTGSPNLSILLGADPEPAFRLLILGTALLPVTVLPVFWILPQLGGMGQALLASLQLLGAIGLAVAIGFVARAALLPAPTRDQSESVDGLMTLALAIIVIGLMGALGPALLRSPANTLIWLALAVGVNLGMQVTAFFLLRNRGPVHQTVPFSIVAGNRNVALFLVTLPQDQADQFLVFLGCYQVPMYLTPILMRRLFQAVQ